MPAVTAKSFSFICGQDDFLVGRMGTKRFGELSGDAVDEFSQEVVNGFAANVDEVETAVNRFREAVQTVPMFGGRRVVWLRDVNFLADSVTGKAETTLRCVEDLQQLLQAVDPAETAVLITAAPVDRRRTFAKWCEKNADFALADAGGDTDSLGAVVQAEALRIGVGFGPGALELLLARTGANTRLLVEEVHKLAAYAADGAVIDEATVAQLTPNAAQGDFFETADAFFSGDLPLTLAALRRHFFAGGDARPVLVALQNRNRILIQVRALADAGDARVGPRGVDGLPKAAERYGASFGDAAGEKTSCNVFTQNPWYVGKLAGAARLPTLRRLIDNQRAFIDAFEEILRRPEAQAEVLRDMAVRCLAA
ncbi:MAG TPA: DNA polymerase III subunit delta [Opitutaceae bacterium]|nr:DNA polymerase III subunit delta [Opitutaceae bacterium]